MFAADKTVHIHASQLCNFRCLHCYSLSGPGKHAHIPADALLGATRQLFGHGYRRAALSGGEPTLHPEFARLCRGLKAQGFEVSVISNGWQGRDLGALVREGSIDVVGLSFDGPEPLHDRIRVKPGAFARVTETLQALRGRAGAVVSVTQGSLPSLPELVGHLAGAGASWVQFHPISEVGRARENAGMTELPEEALMRLILITNLMRSLYPGVRFHCDAVPGAALNRVEAEAGLVSPLVIDSDGTLLPYVHGMPGWTRLGTIRQPIPRPSVPSQLQALVNDCLTRCRAKAATSFFQDLHDMAMERGDRPALAG